MVGKEKQSLKVFMLPWLAQGHITPFLELAKRLSRYNFQTYLCSTPANLTSFKGKIPEKYSHHVHLVELHLPSSPELPPHCHTTNGLPINRHPALRKALQSSKPRLSELLEELRPDFVLHDIILTWVGTVASRHGIPAASFFTAGAAMFSYFLHVMTRPGVDYPFPELRLSDFEFSMVRRTADSYEEEEKDPDHAEIRDPSRGPGVIFLNTSREVEGKYIDYLCELMNMELKPVGAMIQEPSPAGGGDDHEGMEIIRWLDRKEESSTVFVSFGSEYFLNKKDIEEIAHGLELSKANFIWVIRFPKGEEVDVSEVLPKGFVERVGDNKGKIVEKWAPQAKILNNSSIGGFVSHCGWNSLMESIDFGVPIIAMPMHLDQPMNAKLVVDLGVGVEVKRDEKGRLQRNEISRMIRYVLGKENGDCLRRKAREHGDKMRVRSREEMDGVVLKLQELCGKSFYEN
ncbi:beta-D-glucosyl crocetin beta-1,6-glucosyltransferase-like [Henckelia pumila]|uniref:beta-D-glucosyl crocetin beta-1,6-glucosyltransferase-like n=1 Tax=Henckelia pumila TaxID=405737 RepID=UPI003C6DC8F4